MSASVDIVSDTKTTTQPAESRLGVLAQQWPIPVYFLTIALPFQFSLGPLAMNGTRMVLLVLLIPMLLRLFRGRLGPVLPTDILFMIFSSWLLVSMMVNDPGRAIAHTGSVGVEFLGGYMITRTYVRTPRDFWNFCLTFFALILWTLPLAIFEMITARNLLYELFSAMPGVGPIGQVDPDRRLGLDRVSAVFSHSILYGLICASAVSLMAVTLKGAIGTTRRIAMVGCVVFCALTALSSAAIMAMLLQFGLMAWNGLLRWLPGRWFLLMAISAVVYVGAFALTGQSPVDLLLGNATFSSQSAFHRADIFKYGLQSVWKHPMFGIGLADWERPVEMISSSVDNFWLVIAMRYGGFPGLLALATGYLVAVLQVAFCSTRNDPALARIKYGWMYSVIAIAFVLTTVHIWASAFSLVFSIVGAGMWLIHYQPTETPEPAGTDGQTPQDGGRRTAGTALRRARPDRAYTRFPAADARKATPRTGETGPART